MTRREQGSEQRSRSGCRPAPTPAQRRRQALRAPLSVQRRFPFSQSPPVNGLQAPGFSEGSGRGYSNVGSDTRRMSSGRCSPCVACDGGLGSCGAPVSSVAAVTAKQHRACTVSSRARRDRPSSWARTCALARRAVPPLACRPALGGAVVGAAEARMAVWESAVGRPLPAFDRGARHRRARNHRAHGSPRRGRRMRCFKGGSTARLSLVCALAKRKLVVFDSFEGLPEPEPWDAEHRIGRLRQFRRGEYRGAIEEVRANLAAFGRIDVCELVPGWLGSVPHERVPDAIAVAFIDVDLVTSTAAALDLVWPRVAPGGIVFVHDAADAKLTGFLGEWAATVHPRRTSGPAAFAWFEK